MIVFTFQSGDIRINNPELVSGLGFGLFTFQSGDIRIRT